VIAGLLALWTLGAPARAEQTCDLDAAVESVIEQGDRASYLCLAESEEGASRLQRALSEGDARDPRLTRAVAIWLLLHADQPFEPAMVALLSPADVRLLADGVKARRGRRSPVPEHAAVFGQFDWYKPFDHYTDERLLGIDRANLATLERPPMDAPGLTAGGVQAASPAPDSLRPVAAFVIAGVVLGGVLLALLAARESTPRGRQGPPSPLPSGENPAGEPPATPP
jgi:hypothetical protein